MTTATTPVGAGDSGEEQALGIAKDLVVQNAPWKAGIAWEVVMAQGAGLAIAGLLLWLAPNAGAFALQVLALTLLGSAGVSAWRLVRGRVAPRRVAVVGFRAGVGVTTGLLAIMGTLLAGGTDTNRVALTVILGTGILLYGIASAVAPFVGREKGERFPVAGLLISIGAAVLGLWLVIQGSSGIEAVRGTFSAIGILLILAGAALCGYAFYLRSRPEEAPAT